MKKLFTFLVLIVVIQLSVSINYCVCQWEQCEGPYGGTVNALAVSGNTICAGTNKNYSNASVVYLSTNNGQSWTQTGLNDLYVLSIAISMNNIFAGVGGAGVYRSTNNGENWTQTALNGGAVYSLAISEIISLQGYGAAVSGFQQITDKAGHKRL